MKDLSDGERGQLTREQREKQLAEQMDVQHLFADEPS